MAGRFLLWRDKLLLVALGLFFFENSTYLRVAIRSALEGPAFQWAYYAGVTHTGAMAMVRGRGFLGHADYILAQAFIVLLLLVMGLRRPDRIFSGALLAWTSIALGMNAWLLWVAGDRMSSTKDTLGITIPAGWTDLLWPGAAWLAAFALFARDLLTRRDAPAIVWTGTNTILLAGAALVLAISGVLMNLGGQHGQMDFMGIGLIYVALTLFLAGLSPWGKRVVSD